jgi:glycosyltransferase involved in cell wall biosynthesis
MRIAFVAHHGSIHTRRWAGFFAARGHDVHVITCGDGDAAAEGSYEVHDLGTPRPPKSGYLRRVPAARTTLRRLRPDVVHAHHATSYGMLALAGGVRPLVVTAHGSDVLLGRHNPVYRRVLHRVFRAAVLVTVPSIEMRDAVAELAGRDVEVAVFQYGVDSGRLAALADLELADPAALAGPSRIVTARPLRPLYRLDVLLDALGPLALRRTDWECTVFGDGPDREAAEQQARRLGLEGRVTFAGQRTVSEVESALARAHLYVSLAESDGASIALLEAMALGAVPVVSDIASNRAWVRDGENGVLSPIEPSAAGAAIERALGLDRGAVAATNRALVAERADRDHNLGGLERRLLELVARPGLKSL